MPARMVITQNQRIASVDVGTEKGSPDTLSGIQINTVSRMDISQNIRNRTVMITVPFTRLLSEGHEEPCAEEAPACDKHCPGTGQPCSHHTSPCVHIHVQQ